MNISYIKSKYRSNTIPPTSYVEVLIPKSVSVDESACIISANHCHSHPPSIDSFIIYILFFILFSKESS